MIFNRGRSRAPQLEPGGYLREKVSAEEAASLIGVGAARWRQLTGSRAEPHPGLQPIVEPGVRGAQWRVRDVLSFAVSEDREVPSPIPALLPLPDGPRYTAVEHSRAGTRAAAELSARSLLGNVRVWVQLFLPIHPWLCGWAEPPVIVMTPLTPHKYTDVRYLLPQVVREALQLPGWGTVVAEAGEQLAVVILPTEDRAYPSVRALELDSSMLDQARGSTNEAVTPGEWGWYGRDFDIPAGDVASCLGWPALPWWPMGMATRSACAQWQPGRPVVIDVPEALRERQMVARWLMRRQATLPTEKEDLEELARMLDPARHDAVNYVAYHDSAPEEGFELAARARWTPVTPESPRDPVIRAATHPFRAVDQVMGDHTVPDAVAITFLHDGPGDPTFARPEHYLFEDLPESWHQLIRESIRTWSPSAPLTSPRWTRLSATHQQAVARYSGTVSEVDLTPQPGSWGPLHAPVLVGEHGITFCAPTGYDPHVDSADDRPAIALPPDSDPIREVLVLNSMAGHTRGLYRTDGGIVGPLPAASTWRDFPAGHISALIAAFTNTTPVSPSANLGSTPMGELLAKADIAIIEEVSVFRTRATESLATVIKPD